MFTVALIYQKVAKIDVASNGVTCQDSEWMQRRVTMRYRRLRADTRFDLALAE